MVNPAAKSFFTRIADVHREKNYDYSKSVYVNANTKLKIICPLHGEFEMTPGNHLAGKGCRKCAIIRSTSAKTKTLENFINQAVKVHGDRYDYSNAIYVKNSIKLNIVCKKHGNFSQSPAHHLKGHGCPSCAIEKSSKNHTKTTEHFIKKAQLIFGDKYCYNTTVYKAAKSKVNIVCPIHGEFKKIACNHLSGSGCPKCTKQKNTARQHYTTKSWLEFCEKFNIKSSRFYVLKMYNDEEEFIKVGITTSTIAKRYRKKFAYNYTVISSVAGEPEFIQCVENSFKKEFKTFQYKPKNKFAGHTECFDKNVLQLYHKKLYDHFRNFKNT